MRTVEIIQGNRKGECGQFHGFGTLPHTETTQETCAIVELKDGHVYFFSMAYFKFTSQESESTITHKAVKHLKAICLLDDQITNHIQSKKLVEPDDYAVGLGARLKQEMLDGFSFLDKAGLL